jgi:TPR repeat protein
MGLFNKVFKKMFGNSLDERSEEDIEFENQVKNDGYEYAGKRIADILNEKITSQDLARQFVLEELDAARQGNDFAQNFVKSSGFKSFEYVGAINKTRWEGDESELEHLQLFLRAFLMKISDIDLIVKLSTIIVDEIMKKWGLGKYENNDSYIDDSDSNNELEKILAQLDYSEENVENIIEKYSDVAQSLITGLSDVGERDKRNEFAEHMAIAALKKNYKGIVYSCFVKHGGFFKNLLPIPIVKFSDKAFEFLLILLNNYVEIGFSKSFKEYLKNNKNGVLNLANNNNKYAQFLMGFWYVFDEGEKNSLVNRMKWYEKSALNGYLLAMIHTANFYDNEMENLPTDLKKSAYWYRVAALQGDVICAYNLAIMYLQGDGVSYNKSQAALWLSYAWTLVNDDFEEQIETYAKNHNIELKYDPNMLDDIELSPKMAELNHLSTYPNLISKKIILQLEHEKDRRTKRRR